MRTDKEKQKFLREYKKLCIKHQMMLYDTADPADTEIKIGWPNDNGVLKPKALLAEHLEHVLENTNFENRFEDEEDE